MARAVVGGAAVEIKAEESASFASDVERIARRAEQRTRLNLGFTLDPGALRRELLVAVRRAQAAAPKIQLGVELRRTDSERISQAISGFSRRTATIKVVPDVTRPDAERFARRVQTYAPNVRVKVDIDQDRLRRQLREVGKLKIDLDKSHILRQLDEIEDRAERLEGRMSVDVDAAGASARLARISRPRRVEMIPYVNRAAYVTTAALLSQLDRTSGLGSLRRGLSSFFDAVTPVGVARVGSLSAALATLLGGGLTGVANIASLASSLAGVSGAAVPLPGLFAAAGVAALTFSWAAEDIVTQAPDLVDAWRTLQTTVSENFWSTAAGPIRDMTRNLLPELLDAWGRTARGLGSASGEASAAISEALDGGVITRFFGYIDEAVDNLEPALGPVAQALVDLVDFGASQLPELSNWVNLIAQDTAAAISAAAGNGRLQEMTDRGVAGLRDMWRAADGLVGSLAGISRAALASGGATLEDLGNGLQNLDERINSSSFQTGLTRLFTAGRETFDAFLDSVGPGVKNLTTSFIDAYSDFGPIAADALGIALGGFSDMLAGIADNDGFTDFFEGLRTAAQGVAPVLEAAAPAFADLLAGAGELAGAALPELARGFTGVVEGLTPALDLVTSLAREALPGVIDGLVQLAAGVGEVLSDPQVIQDITTAAVDLVAALAEGVQYAPQIVEAMVGLLPVLADVASVIANVVVPALPFLIEALPFIVPLVVGLQVALAAAGVAGVLAMGSLSGPVLAVIGVVGALVAGIGLVITNWDKVGPAVSRAAVTVSTNVAAAIATAQSKLEGLAVGVVSVVQSGFDAIGDLYGAARDFFSNAAETMADIVDRIIEPIRQAIQWVQDLGGAAGNAVRGAGSAVGGAARGLGSDIRDAGGDMLGGVGNVVNNIYNPTANNVAKDITNGANRASAIFGL